MLNVITLLTTLIVLFFTGLLLINSYHEDKRIYLSESRCAAKLVSYGYERSNIATNNGTCWIIHKRSKTHL